MGLSQFIGRVLILIAVVGLFSNLSLAADGITSNTKFYDFSDPVFFNSPTKVRNSGDATYDYEQVTVLVDPAGFLLTMIAKKCVPNSAFGTAHVWGQQMLKV